MLSPVPRAPFLCHSDPGIPLLLHPRLYAYACSAGLETFCSPPLVQSVLRLIDILTAFTKYSSAYAHHGRPFLNRNLKIVAHAH